jgi:hypothetical protein
MKFRVVDLQTSQSSGSPVRVIEQSTGREVGWVNRYLDREYVRRLANRSLRLYALNLLHFAGGQVSMVPVTCRNGHSPNRRSWSIFASNPAYNRGLPVPPSTRASPSPIAPSAMSSPTLLARLPEGSIKLTCAADQWAWPDRAGQLAGSVSKNPSGASCR